MTTKLLAAFAALCLSLTLVRPASAHPVPSDNHDRSLLVRLTAGAVVVDYRLEVDKSRAELDLPVAERARVINRDLYETFCRYFGDILAGNLAADLDGKPLEFRCVSHRFTLRDELGRDLGHLRCDYRIQAACDLALDTEHRFTLRESNYEMDNVSRLQVTLAAGEDVRLESVVAPDAALLARKPSDFQPGDAERLRNLSATFRALPGTPRGAYKPALAPDIADLKSEPEDAVSHAKETLAVALAGEYKPWQERDEDDHPWSLLHLFLDTKQGVGLMLLFAAAFGAVHALTPGHGKTLVAAYLVGERGTVWHALLLGLVTTVTHTAAVILIAGALLFFPNTNRASVQMFLELGGGVLVLGLGLWLLYTRLTGRADHVHLGGGHHHHDHDNDHYHGHHHHHTDLTSAAGSPSVWALLILGFRGGMVPCWDAIAMLVFAISAGRLWLGLPLLLAFSFGLAGVLTGLGVGVVHARNFAGTHFRQGERFRRLVRALPLLSALAITLVGLWLCYDSLHPR
jgi:ABC-type nickel/cobalt efflux system permease component RcnA